MSAYKQVPKPSRQPLSFVRAVTDMGDLWSASRHARDIPFELRNEDTHDRHDAARMELMERGQMSRAGFADERITVTDYTNAYEAISVGEAGFAGMYSATRESYDGAPDSHCPHGTGWTRYEAIADLVQQECEAQW